MGYFSPVEGGYAALYGGNLQLTVAAIMDRLFSALSQYKTMDSRGGSMAGRTLYSFRSGISVLLVCIIFLFFLNACASGNRASMAKKEFADSSGASAPMSYERRRANKSASAGSGLMEREEAAPSMEGDDGREDPSSTSRMVIHTGKFTIEVDNVRRAVEDAEKLAIDFGGFLESSSSSDSFRRARAVIRVPVDKFHLAVQAVEKMGTVGYRSVESSDVTMEFNDSSLRMQTLEKVRARLYELLKKTKKVEEQVKILREIERITAMIDSLKARLAYLKNKASMSTIVLDFTARVREVTSRYMPSPFAWIARLDPDRRSIEKDFRSVTCDTPDGFFSLDKKKRNFDFVSPGEKTGLRLGCVENMPTADLAFWDEAVALDMTNRRWEVSSVETVTGQHGLEFHMTRIKGAGFIYTIAWAVSGDAIVVAEMVQVLEGAEDESPAFRKFLSTVRFR